MKMIKKSKIIMWGVNFALALILILQSDLNQQRIAGLYFGIGEDRVYCYWCVLYRNKFFSQNKNDKKLSTPPFRIYPINKNILIRFSSTKVKQSIASVPSKQDKFKMNPWFVTGITDGEGCFYVSITKCDKMKVGWQVQLFFEIHLNKKDFALLKHIKDFFHVGSIYKLTAQSIQFRVQSIKDLSLIIDHFNQFPLITQKQGDFKLFQRVFNIIMLDRGHLTKEGLYKIVAIKGSMNLGLSDELKKAFPDLVASARPIVKYQKINNPNWLAGFASAEGCVIVKIKKSATKLGEAINLEFQLTQHRRDLGLIKSFIIYFGCGYIEKANTRHIVVNLKVTKLKDILEKIIPFFKKYPILGLKALDFADWCHVADMMKNKAHLTQEGLKEIKKIQAGMNRGRELKKK